MAHSYRLGIVTWSYQVRIPIRSDICHRGCAYTVLQTVQRPRVYSAAYDTVHYKGTLESFELKVGHSPGFGFLLPRHCHDCAKSDVKQYSYSYSIAGYSPDTVVIEDNMRNHKYICIPFQHLKRSALMI